MKKRDAKIERLTCYLAGPMEKVSDESATAWRERIAPKLVEYFGDNIEIVDPCKTEGIKLQGLIPEDSDLKDTKKLMKGWKASGCYEKFDEAIKRIIQADLEVVRRCDFVIFFLDFEAKMGGTISELTVAHERNIPTYTVTYDNVTDANSWILGMARLSGRIFPNFNQLLDALFEDCKEYKKK
jgi:hypothetical protein